MKIIKWIFTIENAIIILLLLTVIMYHFWIINIPVDVVNKAFDNISLHIKKTIALIVLLFLLISVIVNTHHSLDSKQNKQWESNKM